jgi:hypothetical protein
MADRDSDESLPDLVASSSSEYDSTDEQTKEKKAQKVCLLSCIVVSPADAALLVACAASLNRMIRGNIFVQKKDKKDKKAGSKKDKKKSALKPGFLSGLGAAGDDDEASSEIEEAFGEGQFKEARQRRRDVAERRPAHGTMNAELSKVFTCIFDLAATFLLPCNIKCHSHDDRGSS